ncbi:hypothetical protein [Azohydromonas caseinilytica]|uniref:Transposase n=1 Tax=Azohydromonas caseinilytica TaxID=2728836 RepID=A0A848FFD1_9BURK|nr:hypothetical protein [Azohydromonas caseinilytica]NML18128.1 hypothetical protein [Azohydromonas caseinilytica]
MSADLREAGPCTKARGATRLYLPSCSADFNSFGQVFSKPKQLLQRASARTVKALWTAIGELLDAFGPAECRSHSRHCGYGRSG